MALLKNSRKQQKNAAKTVISKNKMLTSKAIGKGKAKTQQSKASAVKSFLKKNKTPSKSPKASSSKRSSIKPSQPLPAPYGKEYLKKLYDDGDKYLDSFPAPKTLNRERVKGYDLNQGVNYDKMFANLKHTGFQATNLGLAIERVNQMIKWRLSDEKVTPDTPAHLRSKEVRENTRCRIFLGCTSNMTSCGMREYIRFLCQHKMIDCFVTTCGGIEEDFMKCMGQFYIGDFHLSGKKLHEQGVYRTGNMLVPAHNYHVLQDWLTPIFKQLHKEQRELGTVWSPSKLINRLGKEINNEESIYYWCWKNDIPVFSPALTDGEIGDILVDHFINEGDGFILDIAQDYKKLNDLAITSPKTGAIIFGGGVIKHHILNPQIRRGGADFSVYINTGIEWDGSDAGAAPDEAVSWGKINVKSEPVKIWAEATLAAPILIAETFGKNFEIARRV